MKINKIITLANSRVRIPFLAMERSLRATGCQLPLLVIPYDDNLFDLPEGATWWEIPEISEWLLAQKAHPTMRKYQCLTAENYQFFDSDVCFIQNPQQTLEPHSGFVTSCGHWRSVNDTITAISESLMQNKSTLWQQKVFNAGQFACNRTLFSVDNLKATAMKPNFIDTCIRLPHHEQPGINLLVFSSQVKITNLTLPPVCMESTWAGDYHAEYEQYWQSTEQKPYLIHWAGQKPADENKPIDRIFYSHLSKQEIAEWQQTVRQQKSKEIASSPRKIARKLKRAFTILAEV